MITNTFSNFSLISPVSFNGVTTVLPPVPAGQQREYPINLDPINAWSMVTSVGVRYKFTKLSDLMLDLRWQLYFSDWIDVFDHKLRYNKFNDWLIWLNFGYIYYLD